MKKLILILFSAFLLLSCKSAIHDPDVKSSEYQEVIQKAKADTLNPTKVIETKNAYFFVKNETIVSKVDIEDDRFISGIILGMCVGLLIAIILLSPINK